MRKNILYNKIGFKNSSLWRWGTTFWRSNSLPHHGGRAGVRGLFFLISLLLFSCSKDSVEEYADEHEVKFGVGFADVWKEGVFNSSKAKVVTRGELTRLDPPVTPVLYKVFVKATDKNDETSQLDLTLTNRSSDGILNSEGVTEFNIMPEGEIIEENYTLYDYEARTVIPEGFTDETNYDNVWGSGTIPLYGTTDYLSGTGVTEEHNLRVYFPLKHNTILVRFVLGVSSEVDALRTLRLTSLKIYRSTGVGTNGKPVFDKNDAATVITSVEPTAPNNVLTTVGRNYLEFHVNANSPSFFETVNAMETERAYLRTVLIVAEYDVYDKNDQLTRTSCTAQNTLTLGFTSKEAGKYFDIYATVKPDFLYVLSDGDKETADVVLE